MVSSKPTSLASTFLRAPKFPSNSDGEHPANALLALQTPHLLVTFKHVTMFPMSLMMPPFPQKTNLSFQSFLWFCFVLYTWSVTCTYSFSLLPSLPVPWSLSPAWHTVVTFDLVSSGYAFPTSIQAALPGSLEGTFAPITFLFKISNVFCSLWHKH